MFKKECMFWMCGEQNIEALSSFSHPSFILKARGSFYKSGQTYWFIFGQCFDGGVNEDDGTGMDHLMGFFQGLTVMMDICNSLALHLQINEKDITFCGTEDETAQEIRSIYERQPVGNRTLRSVYMLK